MITPNASSVTELPSVGLVVSGERAFGHWAAKMAKGRRSLVLAPASLVRDGHATRRITELLGGTVDWTVAPMHTPSDSVTETERQIRRLGNDQVIAVGGGSAIDHMKEARRRLGGGASVLEWTAVPTTLSGAEWNRHAGVTRGTAKVVSDCRAAMPDVVVHDASLVVSTPLHVWWATAVKAMSSAIERAGSRDATPLVQEFALDGLRDVTRGLVTGSTDGPSQLRLLRASFKIAFLGGNVRAGVPGALRRAAGALTGASHSDLASALLLQTLRYNAEDMPHVKAALAVALRETDFGGHTLDKAVEMLLRQHGLPCALRELGVPKTSLEDIAREAHKDPALGGNPRSVRDTDELRLLLEAAW